MRLSSTTHLLPGLPSRLCASLKLEVIAQVDVYQRSQSIMFVDNHEYDWFRAVCAIIVRGHHPVCRVHDSEDPDFVLVSSDHWAEYHDEIEVDHFRGLADECARI